MRGSDENHRKQKLRPRPFFYRILECLLVNEGDGTGKYIFGLCFPMGLADTGRPRREQGGDGEADELGRQAAGGLRNWPAGALLSQQRDEKER